ncbi:MAG: acyltransferase family protein [Flavobacterium sp.]
MPFFSGGFSGVDVFFVISGFLMTKIILSGLAHNNFNFKDFYFKRAKRIIPALLFLIFFVLIISNVIFLTSDLRLNSKYGFLSALFVSNIYFWLYTGYFDMSSQTNILLHTWSLSVEWQFYLLYPLLLWPFRKLYVNNKKKFIGFFILFTLFSFFLMLFLTENYNSFAFYMFPTRSWEMTLGGLASLLSVESIFKNKTIWTKKVIVLLCYFIIIACNPFINESFLWPSAFTLIPTVAAFMILLLNVDFIFLKNKALQFIGNISYSLYLWHWPLYICFKYFGFTDTYSVIILIILSFILGTLSYYLIEINKKIINVKSIGWAFFIILFFSAVLFFKPSNKITQSLSIYDKEVADMGDFKTSNPKEWEKQFNSCGCFITQSLNFSDYNLSKCLNIDQNKKNILLIGDSHAAQLSASLREKLLDYNILEASASYTFPFIEPSGKKDSKFLMNLVFNDFLKKNPDKIDVVLISTHWLMYRNGQLGYKKEDIKENLLKTIKYLQDKKIKVFVLGQTETYTIPYPKIVMLNITFNKNLDSRYIDKEAEELNTYFKSFIPKDVYVDIYNRNVIKYDKKTKTPYMFDDNHLTRLGADQVVDYLIENSKL